MKPGDIVENLWASKGNPIRISIVIKNKGKTVLLTDGKGDIWDHPKSSKLVVIGHVTLSPKEPDYKAMWEQMKGYIATKKKSSPRECNWEAISSQMSGIEDIHTRGQQSGSRTEQFKEKLKEETDGKD